MRPYVAAAAEGEQVVRPIVGGVAVRVVRLKPAGPAAPLAAPPVTIEHRAPEPHPGDARCYATACRGRLRAGSRAPSDTASSAATATSSRAIRFRPGAPPLMIFSRAHRVGDCPSVRERLPDQQRPAHVHRASIATRNPEDPGATPSYRVQRQVSPRRRCRRSPPAAPWPAGRCRRWRAPAAGRRRSTRGTRRSSRCSRDRGHPGRC